MAKVEHFEIPADDVARASAFYRDVFGFQYEPWGDDMGMIRSASGEGIGGDIHLRSGVAHPTIVITVDRIEDTIEAVKANGGEQVGEIEDLDENSRYAYVRDSEGNLIGVYDSTQGA